MTRLPFALMMLFLMAPACGDSNSGEDGENSSNAETESESSGVEEVGFAADVAPIVETYCLCHFHPPGSDQMEAPFLTLNQDVALSQLVGTPSEQLPSMPRVTPGDVGNSYLVHKLRGTHIDAGGPDDSTIMPPGGMLDETEVATIEAWIEAGANP